jgi:hypothetical protein
VRRAAACGIALALCAAAASLAPAASAATHECDGLQICVPVAGPWVIVPTGGAAGTRVDFQLDCPRGYVVGGLDAELSAKPIDVSFAGTLGSPVNPGITTSRSAVFSATYVGADTTAAMSIRPHVGCIPAAGGGGRVPTSASAVLPPGRPTTRRVKTVVVQTGSSRITQACASGERLIAASHAVGFFAQQPPGAALVATVRTRQSVHGSRVAVSVNATKPPVGTSAVVQVTAICAGGK